MPGPAAPIRGLDGVRRIGGLPFRCTSDVGLAEVDDAIGVVGTEADTVGPCDSLFTSTTRELLEAFGVLDLGEVSVRLMGPRVGVLGPPYRDEEEDEEVLGESRGIID